MFSENFPFVASTWSTCIDSRTSHHSQNWRTKIYGCFGFVSRRSSWRAARTVGLRQERSRSRPGRNVTLIMIMCVTVSYVLTCYSCVLIRLVCDFMNDICIGEWSTIILKFHFENNKVLSVVVEKDSSWLRGVTSSTNFSLPRVFQPLALINFFLFRISVLY